MASIKNLQQAKQAIADFVLHRSEGQGGERSLKTIRCVLKTLGNPHTKFTPIHVAGTSGKTSTCHQITNILKLSGQSVGMTVSPHILYINERVQIDGKPLNKKAFCMYLTEFLEEIQDFEKQLIYFELLTAFAFWVFARERVDYAVVEVGIGGLHDSTNILDSPSKVCAITDIGRDHTQLLGNTLTEIATQKAGIIKHDNQVFMSSQPPGLEQVVRKTCVNTGAHLEIVQNKTDNFQDRNYQLAQQTCEYIARRDGFTLATPQKQPVLGRMQEVRVNKKVVILDSAHNPQKMTALVKALQNKYPHQQFNILLALKSGKHAQRTTQPLKEICKSLIATEFTPRRTYNITPQPAGNVARTAQDLGINTTAEPSIQIALKALQQKSQNIIVTGSVYLVSDVLKNLQLSE